MSTEQSRLLRIDVVTAAMRLLAAQEYVGFGRVRAQRDLLLGSDPMQGAVAELLAVTRRYRATLRRKGYVPLLRRQAE